MLDLKWLLILGIFLYMNITVCAQDRISNLQQQLNELSQSTAGLNDEVETAVSNTSLYEFLKGLAVSYKLNLNIDPSINEKITTYFSHQTVKSVLLYLARQYDLDFVFTGSIIYITPYKDPSLNLPRPAKPLFISYDSLRRTLTMDLQDDSLVNVAKRITQLSNQNIIVLPELSAKKVNGYFQELPVGGALEKLALSNAMKVNQGMDSSYIIEALRPNAQVGSQQTPVNGSISVRESAGKKLISLDVIGVPIKDVIRSIADQGNINYFIYSDITGSTTAKVHDVDFDKVLELVLKSTNYTYNIDNGIYMIGDRQDEGFRSSKLIELKYRSVDSLLPLLPAELMKGVTVKEFREYNSFLLNGSEPQIKEIDSFIRALDKTVPMVMIEVILMDVQKTRTIATGLQLGVSDSVRSGGTLFGAGTDFTFSARDINRFIDQLGINNAFNIGRVTPNFYASLRALESNSNVEIRQTPKLSTLNGHEANLSIGSRRYYSITTQNVVGALDARTIVTQEFFPVDANLAIKILPFVSGDEHATLKIDVNISDFIGNPPLNLPPPTATSKFNTILRVKNEEMVVLGGIERNEKTDETSGTPLLSRIPILKWLFSSKSKTTGKTYSVVFIKPTIIY